jgi:FkbM family methyltransferase
LRNVRFHSYGLSEAEGLMHLLVSDEVGDRLVGVSRLVSSGSAEVIAGRTVPVPLRRLDDVLSEESDLKQVRLLKVDVEGHELSVLRGSEELLKRARPMVVCEVGHANLNGMAEYDLFRWLEARNFVAFGILLRPLSIRRIGAAEERLGGSAEDALFVPVERVKTLPTRLLFR